MTICRPIFLPLLLLAPWAWAATPGTPVLSLAQLDEL